jgi:hypothetical protein
LAQRIRLVIGIDPDFKDDPRFPDGIAVSASFAVGNSNLSPLVG